MGLELPQEDAHDGWRSSLRGALAETSMAAGTAAATFYTIMLSQVDLLDLNHTCRTPTIFQTGHDPTLAHDLDNGT
jgi:hypothetical protein